MFAREQMEAPRTPILDPTTLCQEMSMRLNTAVSPDDITDPRSDRVQAILSVVCRTVLEVPDQCLNGTPSNIVMNQPYAEDPGQYERGIPLLIQYKLMNAFLIDNRCDEFELRFMDLITPKPKRIRHLYSIIVDYLRFMDTMQEEYTAVRDQFRAAIKANAEAGNKIAEMQRQRDHMRAKNNTMKRQENALLAEKATCERTLADSLKEMQTLEGNRAALEAEVDSVQQETARLRDEGDTVEAVNANLAMEIVSSPRRVRDELAALKEQRQQLDSEAQQFTQNNMKNHRNMQTLKTAREQLDQHKQDIARMRDMEADLHEKASRLRDIQQEKHRQEDAIRLARATMSAVEQSQAADRERFIAGRAAHIKTLDKMSEEMDALTRQLKMLLSEEGNASAEMRQMKAQLNATQSECTRHVLKERNTANHKLKMMQTFAEKVCVMECEYAQQMARFEAVMARAEAGRVDEGDEDTNASNTRSVDDDDDEENTQGVLRV